MDYTGGRTEPEIVNWILKKVGPPSSEVTCSELKDKIENAKLALVYFGDTSAKEFTDVYMDVANNPTASEKY
jgi:hypothetical protein